MATKTEQSLEELLNDLMKTARDCRPADTQAAHDAREIRTEILRRFGAA